MIENTGSDRTGSRRYTQSLDMVALICCDGCEGCCCCCQMQPPTHQFRVMSRDFSAPTCPPPPPPQVNNSAAFHYVCQQPSTLIYGRGSSKVLSLLRNVRQFKKTTAFYFMRHFIKNLIHFGECRF